MSAYHAYPHTWSGQPQYGNYPMAASPTMHSSSMPTYTGNMPTGTVPTTTITTSGYAPAYSAPTYAYPQIVERQIVLPPEAPPVQHVKHVVYQQVEPRWQEPPYDPGYRTLAERFPLMGPSPQRARPSPQRAAPPPEEEVEIKVDKKRAQRSAAAAPAPQEAPAPPIIKERIIEQEVLVDKIVEVEVPVEVERIVERELVIEREVERLIEVPVTTEKRVEVAVPYERVVHIQVPVEKIVYKDVPVPVQMNPVREVTKEIPRPYEVIKEVPMHFERTVTKEVLVPMERVQHFVEQDEVIVRKHRVGEELRPAQLTQETLAEAQRLRSLQAGPKFASSMGSPSPVPVSQQTLPQGFLYSTHQGAGNGLYNTTNNIKMAPAYSPKSAGLYGNSVVRAGSPGSMGTSFNNYGSPARTISPATTQLASRTLSPGAHRRL